MTERQTAADWVHVGKDLDDVHDPEVERILLVLDNLKSPSPGSLYEAFPPAESTRLADKLEIHYPPEQGGWLSIAAIELSTIAGQCLGRRIPDRGTLEPEVATWEAERTSLGGTARWQFTSEQARVRLKRNYPSNEV